MKTRWIWRALLLLLMTIAVAAALGLPAWNLRQPMSDGNTVAAGAGRIAGQSITLHFEGLDGFAVRPEAPLPDGTSRLVLHLRPADAAEGTDLLTVTTDVGSVWDGTRLRFSFPAMKSSPGQKILLLVKSPDAPLVLAASQVDYYPEGASTAGGDLVFEARFKGNALARLAALPGRLSQNKPGLLGEPWFYPLLLVGLLTVAVGAGEAFWHASSVPERATPS